MVQANAKNQWAVIVCIAFSAGCLTPVFADPPSIEDTSSESSVGLLDEATNQPPASEQPADPTTDIPFDRLLDHHLADIEQAREDAQRRLREAEDQQDASEALYQRRILERLETVRRPEQTRLSLEDALRRGLEHNYSIQVFSYNPAIETTRVVEAESAFDAVFFSNVQNQNLDQPTPTQLTSSAADFLNLSAGVRKRLPTGALVTGQYGLSRSFQDFAFQVLNPAYTSSLTLDLQQPLLRGFGLDVNRATIILAGHERGVRIQEFERQVRDTLRDVEEAYWRLVQARSDLVITAKEVGDLERVLDYLHRRADFDVLPVNIASTEADLEIARSDFVRRRTALFDAEDNLLFLLNDPALNLVDPLEIVPTDFPHIEHIVFDPLAAVQTALENREEIREQELRVKSATVSVGQARNAELPQLDLQFSVDFRGLAGNADRSFDELSRTNFISYTVGVILEVPIGNRGPRAARRRAELAYAQARAQLQQVLEQIVLDVNLAVRRIETAYDQIAPRYASVEAREREVESLVVRAERMDYPTLTSELGARRNRASTRSALLSSIVDYNIAIIDLERAKGTLLQYNNVYIPRDPDALHPGP